MPLYELDSAGELLPFRRFRGGAELYEREIEDLAWANPEEVVGETLFLVQRSPRCLAAAGRRKDFGQPPPRDLAASSHPIAEG